MQTFQAVISAVINSVVPAFSRFNISTFVYFGVFATALFLLSIGLYLFSSYVLYRIGRRAGVIGLWRAWVPILQQFLLLKIARLPEGWIFVMFSNVIVSLGFGLAVAFGGYRPSTSFEVNAIKGTFWVLAIVQPIFLVYMWARISKIFGKSGWLGFLMVVPIANFIYMIFLAFGKSIVAVQIGSTTPRSTIAVPREEPISHPEMQEGEFLLGNYTKEDFEKGVRWRTKRIGSTAYGRDGKVVRDIYPVFVKIAEFKQAGLRPKTRI
jgi:hypothetical protein